ncbi:hypothetical protein D3C78_1341310 [compost metagenome]
MQRREQGFAALHPAARQIPARKIGVPHEKNPALFIVASRTHTKSCAAREQKNEMQKADEDTHMERTGLPPGCFVIHPGFSPPAGFYWTRGIS